MNDSPLADSGASGALSSVTQRERGVIEQKIEQVSLALTNTEVRLRGEILQARHEAKRGTIMMGLLIAIMVLTITLGVVGSVLFASRASAASLPYTVDGTGITLLGGATFPDNGHVNITADAPHSNLHFEAKCITRTDAECAGARHAAAQFIGKSFIPWSAFGLSGTFCVSWVQVSMFNEHFGEGGEAPVCTGPSATPTPTATPSPTPTSVVSPTPTPTATPSATPTSTGTPQATPSPSSTPPGSSAPSATPAISDRDLAATGGSWVPATIGLALGLLIHRRSVRK